MHSQTKGTYHILNDEYKHLSLVHGVIAWNTGVIRRLYDKGHIFPVLGKDKENRKVITGYEKLDETHKTVRLIHALFNRVPGTTGEADFVITSRLKTDDPSKIAEICAQIVAATEIIATNLSDVKNTLGQFCTELEQQKQNIETEYAKNQENKKLLGQISGLGKLITAVQQLQKSPDSIKEYDTLCKASSFKTYYSNNQAQNTQLCTLFAKIKELNALFVSLCDQLLIDLISPLSPGHIILQSLWECDPSNPEKLYNPYTTQTILLAFVYQACSHDRLALKTFYECLNKGLDGKLLKNPLSQKWVDMSFEPVTQAQALAKIENIFKAKNLSQSIDNHFENFVYWTEQIRTLPDLFTQASASYFYGPGKQTYLVPNCMDNAIRNFISLFAYDKNKNCFSAGQLKKALNLKAIDPQLEDFLNCYGDVNKARSAHAHDDWFTLIADIPYATYCQAINSAINRNYAKMGKVKGLIKIENPTSAMQSWATKNNFDLLGTYYHGYELYPSIRNIIIVLNHLLKLNLFSNQQEFEQLFASDDFIPHYFPILCKKLRIDDGVTFTINKTPVDIKTVAANDGSDSITCNFCLNNIHIKFFTNRVHGDFQVTKAADNEKSRRLKELVSLITDFSHQPTLPLLMVKISESKESLWSYMNMFACPLEDPDYRIDQILLPKNASLKAKIAYRDLLSELGKPSMLPFLEILTSDDLRIIDQTYMQSIIQPAIDNIQEVYWQHLLILLIGQGYQPAINTSINVVHDYLSTNDPAKNICHMLGFLNALLQQRQGLALDNAILAAKHCIQNYNYKTYPDSLTNLFTLFKTVVEKGHCLPEALHAATLPNPESVFLWRLNAIWQNQEQSRLKLLLTLVNQSYQPAFPQALKVAKIFIEYASNNEALHFAMDGFELLTTLIKQSYQPAFRAAGIVIANARQSDDYMVQYAGQALEQALEDNQDAWLDQGSFLDMCSVQ